MAPQDGRGIVSAAAAAAPLDVARVRRTIAQLRSQLAEAVQLLGQLYEGRAWVALGLPSWEALCAEELPELGALLDVAQRRSVVVELRRGGASLRAAAAPVKVSAATAKAWCDDAGVVLATVTSLDGRVRPGTAAPGRHRATPRTDRTVALLAEAGPLSVVEVARRQKIGQHIASATLTRLAQAGRVSYRPGARRGVMGTWAAGTVAR
jgi:hypothetical protein